jgi:hypothetical protein
MRPDDVAAELVKGIRRGSFMIVPGMEGRLALAMKRHLPRVVDLIMRRAIGNAQKGRAKATVTGRKPR